MTVIKGKLDPFFETGTEGVIWSVYEEGKQGYDGLHCLHNGDHLTVFHPENPGIIIWEGNINLEYERNYRPYPMNPEYGQQEVFGYWVHGLQRNVEPETWATWFFKEYPVELIVSEVGYTYFCKSSTISGHSWKGKGSPFNDIRDKADLTLVFKSGDCYRYKDVDYDTYENFRTAESMGKYFFANIKDKFVTEKIILPSRAK